MQPLESPVPGLVVLPSTHPVPVWGVLPVYSFLLRAPSPILIDAGQSKERHRFLEALDGAIDLADLSFIVLTHEEPDHAGAVPELLRYAPSAQLVASRLCLGKLSAVIDLPLDRVIIAEVDELLDLGGRRLRVLRPPMYDSPGTLTFITEDEGYWFASDAFGAFIPRLVERACDIAPDVLEAGLLAMSGTNSPWLAHAADRLARDLEEIRGIAPAWTFASHLPPVPVPDLASVLEMARGLPEAARKTSRLAG